MKSWFLAGSHPQEYEQGIDSSVTYHGKKGGYLKAKAVQLGGFGTLMQMFKANDYRNKRMRFSAVVKSEGVEDWAGLWMRIDGPKQGETFGFDNMHNRPMKGTTDWQKYEVVLDVPQESVCVAFGLLLVGPGQVWLNDVEFEEVSADVPTTSFEGDRRLLDKPDHHGIIDEIVQFLLYLAAGFLSTLGVDFLSHATFHFWLALTIALIVAVILLAIRHFNARQTDHPAKAGNLLFTEDEA